MVLPRIVQEFGNGLDFYLTGAWPIICWGKDCGGLGSRRWAGGEKGNLNTRIKSAPWRSILRVMLSCNMPRSGFLAVAHMGGCQTYGPFLGTLNIRCRIIIGIQKGTIILTTTHMD